MTARYEKIRKVLTECRDIAMEWTLRGRIPECGKFGEIAQDLDAVCAEIAAQQPTEGEEVMVKTPNDVLFILPLQPSGRSIGPRFVVHVPLVEAPAVKELQAEIEALRADVAEWKRVAAAQAELHDEAEARANKLDKILRAYQAAVNRIDDLIEYSLPMPPETKAALYAILDDLTEELAKENKA